MNLENSFLHVPIEESSRRYTYFITKEEMFELSSGHNSWVTQSKKVKSGQEREIHPIFS